MQQIYEPYLGNMEHMKDPDACSVYTLAIVPAFHFHPVSNPYNLVNFWG